MFDAFPRNNLLAFLNQESTKFGTTLPNLWFEFCLQIFRTHSYFLISLNFHILFCYFFISLHFRDWLFLGEISGNCFFSFMQFRKNFYCGIMMIYHEKRGFSEKSMKTQRKLTSKWSWDVPWSELFLLPDVLSILSASCHRYASSPVQMSIYNVVVSKECITSGEIVFVTRLTNVVHEKPAGGDFASP